MYIHAFVGMCVRCIHIQIPEKTNEVILNSVLLGLCYFPCSWTWPFKACFIVD